jgi:hypothetical protein
MFKRARRNRGSYWYLPDDLECQELGGIEPIKLQSEQPRRVSPSQPMIDRLIKAARERVAKSNESKENTEATLESALSSQTQFTTWPSSIWDSTFENCEAEIVFDWPHDSEIECLLVDDSASKKSFGTLETEAEALHSPGLLPEYQNTWELEDLDLSAIAHEGDADFGSPFTHPTRQYSPDSSCSLVACSSGLRNDVVSDEKEPTFRQRPGNSIEVNSDSLIVEELFDSRLPPRPALFLSYLNRRKRKVRFADEEGEEMDTIHLLESNAGDDTHLQRVLILIMLPELKQFEFVHAEYSIESRLPVSSLIQELPSMVSGPQIKKQRYVGLCHAAGGSELDNSLALQDSKLASDDILFAVPKGYSANAMYELAKGLVADEKILKAVSCLRALAVSGSSRTVLILHFWIAGEANESERTCTA